MVTKVSWKPNAGGDWSTAANWSGGAVPNSNDAVTINTSSFQTITHSGGTDTVASLSVGNDLFVLSGGSFGLLATSAFTHGFTQTGGVLQAGIVQFAAGSAALLLGGQATGTTTFSVAGTMTLANYTLAGSAKVQDTKLIDQTGQITIGDASGTGAHITIGSSAAYDVAGDYGIGGGAASAEVVNMGIFAKTNGSATSVIGVDMVSTGTIEVAAGGTLDFAGPNNTIGGAISGAGRIEFGGESNTTLTVATIAGGLQLDGNASVALGTNTLLGGSLLETNDFGQPALNLGGHTLTADGANSVLSGSLTDGSGTLLNKGTLTMSGATIGGTVSLDNAGTIDAVGSSTLGDGSGMLAQIVNDAGAVYDFTADVNLGQGSNAGATLFNNGLLEKTLSNGSSSISAVVSNSASGTILSSTGTLAFSNGLANSGTITGTGHVQLTGTAQATFSAGTVLSVAEFDVTGGATLTLATSLSYGGVLTEQANFGQAVINLGANTLTLTGAGNVVNGFEGASSIIGSGRLANAGTLGIGQLTLGGTDVLLNTGAVNQDGSVTIGDASGKTAMIDNAAKAVWTLTNTNGIGNGAAAASGFENFGTLRAAAGGTNVVTVNTSLTNEKGGLITVASGALAINGTFVNAGTVSGADVQIVGGLATLNVGTALAVAKFEFLNGGMVTLGENLAYHGTWNEAANFGQTDVNLAGHTLSLSGAVFISGFEGSALISGGGTLSTSGMTTLGQLTVGGASSYSNSGSISAVGNVTIGDSAAATLTNAIGGIYDLVNDSSIGVGSNLQSDFINGGLFEKTAGTGTSVVNGSFANNGTITVTSGTIEFTAGSLVNNGTINGVVSTDQSGNVFITHH